MPVYPPISMNLTFQGTSYVYQVFIGELPPSKELGRTGDLFFLSSNPNEARARIKDKLGKLRDETEQIYLKIDCGWIEMRYG